MVWLFGSVGGSEVIAAVATVYNEEDIIGLSIEHLLASGVDRIYVAHGLSTDDTLDILRSFGEAVVLVDDPEQIHMQPQRTHELGLRAGDDGATWIIPFDADEFIYNPAGLTIPEALATVEPENTKVVISCFGHTDWDHRHTTHRDLPKYAWRTGYDFHCVPGNHMVIMEGGEQYDVLWLRELQFRSFEHMKRKVEERCRTLDPALGNSAGGHITRMQHMNEQELREAWDGLMSVDTIVDPIPMKVRQ